MRNDILGPVFILLVASGLGAGYFVGAGSNRAGTTTTIVSTTTWIPPPQYPFSLISAMPVHDSQFNSSYGAFLAFNVTVRNLAAMPVYYEDLCGTSLSLDVVPSSAVSPVVSPLPLMGCRTGPRPILPGATVSIFTPVNSKYVLKIVQHGTFVANLSLGWGWTDSSVVQATAFVVPFTIP